MQELGINSMFTSVWTLIFSVAFEYQFTPVVKMLDPPLLLTGKVGNYLNRTLMDAIEVYQTLDRY